MSVKEKAATQAKTILSDVWHAIRTQRMAQLFVVLLVVSIVCWKLPYVSLLLYPFKVFATVIHEASHALVARLTGGNVALLSISSEETGLTGTIGGIGPLITMAGYLGTALFGGLLIWWGRTPREARAVLQAIGTCFIAIAIFYVGGKDALYSFFWVMTIGVALLFVARKGSERTCHLFLLFLAVTTIMSCLQDDLLFLTFGGMPVDAVIMEKSTMVPAIVWSLLWSLASVVIMFLAFWLSYRPKKKIGTLE